MDEPSQPGDDWQLEEDLRIFRPVGEMAQLERTLRALALRAATDPDLRARLLINPMAVLEDEQVAHPDQLTVQAHEERDNRWYFVLPMSDALAEDYSPAGQEVLRRVRADQGFARRLIANPRQTVEASLGFRFPPGLEVVVLQNDSRCLHLVLEPVMDSDELSDLALEAIAGGKANPFRRRPGGAG